MSVPKYVKPCLTSIVDTWRQSKVIATAAKVALLAQHGSAQEIALAGSGGADPGLFLQIKYIFCSQSQGVHQQQRRCGYAAWVSLRKNPARIFGGALLQHTHIWWGGQVGRKHKRPIQLSSVTFALLILCDQASLHRGSGMPAFDAPLHSSCTWNA